MNEMNQNWFKLFCENGNHRKETSGFQFKISKWKYYDLIFYSFIIDLK